MEHASSSIVIRQTHRRAWHDVDQWTIDWGTVRLGWIRQSPDDERFAWRTKVEWLDTTDTFHEAVAALVAAAPEGVLDGSVFPEDELVLQVPLGLRKGKLSANQSQSIVSAVETLDYVVLDLMKRPSWSGLRLLDFGCGVKFTQALLQVERDLASYHGIDVDAEMIDFLNQNVADDRFTFAHVDFANEMYNPDGMAMAAETQLPGGGGYDLITAQSVLTHFAPHDFEAGLAMLAGHLGPDGVIFFTCIIGANQTEDFVDLDPETPLRRASYSEQHALELIERAGLDVVEYRRRGRQEFLPEHFLCRAG